MIRQRGSDVELDLFVQPRASRARIGPVHGDRIKMAITAPPVDGAANQAVIELLAKELGRPKADITITSGTSSRRKTVRIAKIGVGTVEALWL